MRNILFILGIIFVFSCQEKDDKTAVDTKPASENTTEVAKKTKTFEMYEMSELALLMEQMYVENQRLKTKIIANDSLGSFPAYFKDIHESVFTNPAEKDAFFTEQAALFINAQKMIYEEPQNAKAHFNEAVQACISCHEVKCTGPISKIKKLIIP
jgi:cytochrome c553